MALKDEYISNIIMYGNFQKSNSSPSPYEFKLLPQYETIFKAFDLKSIAADGDTFDKSLRIMQWITDNSVYNGASPLPPTTSDKIIEFSYGKGEDGAINCANKAILLADALMSIGIFAMPVAGLNLIPDTKSENFMAGHSHVVTHVFLPEANKWVVLDPSFNTHIVGKENIPLNVIEIIAAMRQGKELFTVSNENKEISTAGLACLTCCLLEICIWRGNDYTHRNGMFGWDTAYYLVSEAYLLQVKKLLDEAQISEEIRAHLRQYVESEKISIDELLAIPELFQ